MKLPRCHRHTDAQSDPGTPRSLTEASRKPSTGSLLISKASKLNPDATATSMPDWPLERQEASRRPHGNLPQEDCTFPSHQNRKICRESQEIIRIAVHSGWEVWREGGREVGKEGGRVPSTRGWEGGRVGGAPVPAPAPSPAPSPCLIEDRSQFINRQSVFCIVFYMTLESNIKSSLRFIMSKHWTFDCLKYVARLRRFFFALRVTCGLLRVNLPVSN